MKSSLVLVLAMFCISCSTPPIREEYYIPNGYVGWVNLIHEQEGSARVFQTDHTTSYLLVGDLVNCYINTVPKEGSFTYHYYYYSPTSIRSLKSEVSYKTYVPVRYMTSIRLAGRDHIVEAFYVAKHPMATSLPDDSIPKNPLQNFIPATILP
jgi:hypothetical protein